MRKVMRGVVRKVVRWAYAQLCAQRRMAGGRAQGLCAGVVRTIFGHPSAQAKMVMRPRLHNLSGYDEFTFLRRITFLGYAYFYLMDFFKDTIQ